MFIPQCLFCDHINPATAKFCNECGSPLHLKPCGQCEAINDRAAKTCYKCGTAHLAPVVTSEAVAVTPGVAPPDATPAVVSPNPGATAEQRPKYRVAKAALPPLVLLGALSVSAYYAYSYPVQLKEWLSAARATVGARGGDTSVSSVAGTGGEQIPHAPTVSDGAASAAAIGPVVPPVANEPVDDRRMSLVRQDSVPATGVASVDDQTPASSQALTAAASQPQISTPRQATPAPRATRVEKKSSTGSKATAKKPKTPAKKPAPAQAIPSSKASSTTAGPPKTAQGK